MKIQLSSRLFYVVVLQVDNADDVFDRMKSKGVRPNTAVFNTLIGAHGKKRELKKAFKLFNDVSQKMLLRAIY